MLQLFEKADMLQLFEKPSQNCQTDQRYPSFSGPLTESASMTDPARQGWTS